MAGGLLLTETDEHGKAKSVVIARESEMTMSKNPRERRSLAYVMEEVPPPPPQPVETFSFFSLGLTKKNEVPPVPEIQAPVPEVPVPVPVNNISSNSNKRPSTEFKSRKSVISTSLGGKRKE